MSTFTIPFLPNIYMRSFNSIPELKDSISRISQLVIKSSCLGSLERNIINDCPEDNPLCVNTELGAVIACISQLSEIEFKNLHSFACKEKEKDGIFRPNMFKIQLCMTNMEESRVRFLASASPRIAGSLLALSNDPEKLFHSAWCLLAPGQEWTNTFCTVFVMFKDGYRVTRFEEVTKNIMDGISSLGRFGGSAGSAGAVAFYDGTKLRAIIEIADDTIQQLEEQAAKECEEKDNINDEEDQERVFDIVVNDEPTAAPMGDTVKLFESD